MHYVQVRGRINIKGWISHWRINLVLYFDNWFSYFHNSAVIFARQSILQLQPEYILHVQEILCNFMVYSLYMISQYFLGIHNVFIFEQVLSLQLFIFLLYYFKLLFIINIYSLHRKNLHINCMKTKKYKKELFYSREAQKQKQFYFWLFFLESSKLKIILNLS